MAALLHEQVRPQSFDAIIGQERAVKQLKRIGATTGHAGRAYWITGKTGQGKTTLARIIALEVADPFMVEEINADDLTAERLREIERTQHTFGWGAKTGRAFIVNEAHGLSGKAVRMLKGMLEPIPAHVVWVFTTTRAEQGALFDNSEDAAPLIGRCVEIALTTQGLCKPAGIWLKTVAESRGLDGQPVARYERLFNECGGSFRMALERIEGGAMLSEDGE